VLPVLRTIADLEASYEIKPHFTAQALGYRSLDRSKWMWLRKRRNASPSAVGPETCQS
jgi:hypothetical protein